MGRRVPTRGRPRGGSVVSDATVPTPTGARRWPSVLSSVPTARGARAEGTAAAASALRGRKVKRLANEPHGQVDAQKGKKKGMRPARFELATFRTGI